MRYRLMVRVLDLIARLPGCGFVGWALLGVAIADESKENRGKTTPN